MNISLSLANLSVSNLRKHNYYDQVEIQRACVRTEQEVISVCHASCGTRSNYIHVKFKKIPNQFYLPEEQLAAVSDVHYPYKSCFLDSR